VRDGATIVGPKPTRARGLAGFPGSDEEVRQLADELWGAVDGELSTEHRFGAGRVISGRTVPQVLADTEVPPDCVWEGGDARTRLSFVHRTTENAEIYFVVNDNERWEEVEGLFRVRDWVPELWDPAAGTALPARTYRAEGDRTRVLLRLPPGGSTFVVFRSKPGPPSRSGERQSRSPALPSRIPTSLTVTRRTDRRGYRRENGSPQTSLSSSTSARMWTWVMPTCGTTSIRLAVS